MNRPAVPSPFRPIGWLVLGLLAASPPAVCQVQPDTQATLPSLTQPNARGVALDGDAWTKADAMVATYATTGRDGSWSRVDLIPVYQGSPASGPAPDEAQKLLLDTLQTLSGTDLNGDWSGISATLPTAGFDTYTTGLPPGPLARRILGANNLYDLLQTTTGKPQDGASLATQFADRDFPGFTGGDIDGALPGGDPGGEGGPGLFSNVPPGSLPPGRAVPPGLPTLPNTMGGPPGTSGRGPQADDEHQFIQVRFRYALDTDSLFNPHLPSNSFLGDTLLPGNVHVVKHSVQHPAPGDIHVVDQLPAHVTGVGVIGGVTALPTGFNPALGLPANAVIDQDPTSPTFSNAPTGSWSLIGDPHVFTYIAHEHPAMIPVAPFSPGPTMGAGYIVDELGIDGEGTRAGTLVLPAPTAGLGGRVFGATAPHVGSVNDFATSGDQQAAAVGFLSIEFTRLRSGGQAVDSPYFHSFPLDQGAVGADDRAVDGSFNRGAALRVSPLTQLPSIDILDPEVDALGPYDPNPPSDAVNTISTHARFRVDFDREMVPNSVGFSRRHTLHGTPELGVVFPFNGNTRPIENPSGLFTAPPANSPLAPSLYLAVNQPAGVNQATGLVQPVASPYQVKGAPPLEVDGTFLADDGVTKFDPEINGLTPGPHNTLATLPRAVVPVDIRPLNQNNLQAYVVEPLVELPPGTVVTLGVAMNGLGTTHFGMVNHGNPTRSGTVTTPYQALDTTTGLFEDPSLKTAVLPNHTVVKVNAGPMSLDGLLFHGGTQVALQRLVNGDPHGPDDLTTGGYNVCRSFRVGADDVVRRVNAPVSPQALYLAMLTGGLGVLDLAGNGYTTNAPGGGLLNPPIQFWLESSRFLPAFTQALGGSPFNWFPGASELAGEHRRAFGILGRHTSGSGALRGNIESDLAVGAPIPTGAPTPRPGVNEGSSGYETLVKSGIVSGDPQTASEILAPSTRVGIVRDVEVGAFLDTVYFDPENPWSQGGQTTYNNPLGGKLPSNTIADPPTPNPPPLRFPVGLPYTAVVFDQDDLTRRPMVIEGNEVFPSDSLFAWSSGVGVPAARQANGLIFLDAAQNPGNPTTADQPHLPNVGFNNPFPGPTAAAVPDYVQTGPAPRSCTAAAVLLASINNQFGPGTAGPAGLIAPSYQSRQQIGNFLFVADGVNKKVHALNSNTMKILASVTLPDPYGLGLTPDLQRLFVSNEDDDSVSIVDADPTSPTFMTELKRVDVGDGPRAVACQPDREDVFVLNYAANTISILDQATGVVRKTLTSDLIIRPLDVALGMRESAGGPAFASGTWHGYISNFLGNDVLVYQGGPDGLAGIGFDDIIAAVSPGAGWQAMVQPRGITFDPDAPLDGFSRSIGCYVAHRDATGRAVASRITYSQDTMPGVQFFDTTAVVPPSDPDKTFEVTAQYLSAFTGVGYDVALPDYNRERYEQEDYGAFYNLVNAGATAKLLPMVAPNWKFPLADNILPAFFDGPRWDPDRLYLSIGGNLIDVFVIATGQHVKTIPTPSQVGVMASYYSQ